MEARYVKEQLETMLGGVEIFLDFDSLQDMRVLVRHVRDSDVVVIMMTSEVMLRPWCILEIHAAVSAGIPIVGVTLTGSGIARWKRGTSKSSSRASSEVGMRCS